MKSIKRTFTKDEKDSKYRTNTPNNVASDSGVTHLMESNCVIAEDNNSVIGLNEHLDDNPPDYYEFLGGLDE